MRIPLIIHEQNASPGITNRLLSKVANKILCAFPTSSFKNQKALEVIGNPIRPEISAMHAKTHDFYKHNLNVLVLGGSQGAKLLNDTWARTVLSTAAWTRWNGSYRWWINDFDRYSC